MKQNWDKNDFYSFLSCLYGMKHFTGEIVFIEMKFDHFIQKKVKNIDVVYAYVHFVEKRQD